MNDEYDIFFKSTLDLIAIADLDGFFKRVNPSWERTLGWPTEELLSRPWLDFVHPEDYAPTIAEAEKLGKGASILEFENRYRCRDGSYRWLSWRVPAPSPGSTRLYAIARDVTERKLAEKRMRLVVEASPSALIMIDPKGRISLVNSQTEKIFGYERAELLGQPVEMLMPTRYQKGHVALRTGFQSNPQTRSMGVGRDLYGLHKDGREIPVEIGLNPLAIEGQSLVLVAIVDISERKRAEDLLRTSNADLERQGVALRQANQELESFSYSVSHDLRAPLRAIDGFARILLEDHGDRLDGEARRLFDVIRSNAVKMGRLIDDLLEFSRLGRKELQKTDVDMFDLARGVADELRVPEGGRALELTVHPLPPVRGDRALLRQVWVNLLSNALKYSRPRNPARVTVGAEPRGAELVFHVSDNGVGFDMQYASKLFGVFQRLHAAAEFEGTGVGLAIVQRAIQRHGGRVWAESRLNEGSTFYFALPASG